MTAHLLLVGRHSGYGFSGNLYDAVLFWLEGAQRS